MNTRRIILSLMLGLALVMALGGLATAQTLSTPVSSTLHVTPYRVAGNPPPNCAFLGYDFGFKIDGWDGIIFPEPPDTVEYSFTWTAGTQSGFETVVTAGQPDQSVTVRIRTDGLYVDWWASTSINAVIVKGGDDSNIYYHYPPGSPIPSFPWPPYTDTGLSTPGAVNDISHVEFCTGIPLAVTLASFSAVQQGDAVQVAWETVSEMSNRGFNLYRATSAAGPFTQLNTTLIPSQSQGNPSGFTYTWGDRAGLVAGTDYYYLLEDLDLSGATAQHGPVSVSYVGPTAVGISAVQASPAAGAAALPWLWIVAGAGAALGVSRLRRRS